MPEKIPQQPKDEELPITPSEDEYRPDILINLGISFGNGKVEPAKPEIDKEGST